MPGVVVGVDARLDDGSAWQITVERHSPMEWVVEPQVGDLPEDIRAGLLRWLGSAPPT